MSLPESLDVRVPRLTRSREARATAELAGRRAARHAATNVAIDCYPDPGGRWLPTYSRLGYTHLTEDLVRTRFASYVDALASVEDRRYPN